MKEICIGKWAHANQAFAMMDVVLNRTLG